MKKSILNRRNPWTDKDVEKHWDSVSDIYIAENEKVKKAHDQRFTESIKHLELKGGDCVLNISSRDCEADDYLRKAKGNIEVLNAEISQGLISEAKKYRPKATQIKIETYSLLPFEDRSFDKIISLETLEHVENPIKFLQELYRVSKPDARLVMSCPPRTSEPAYRIYTFLFGGHGEGPHRFPKSGEVKTLLKHTGWKLILHKGTVLFPVGTAFFQDLGEHIINRFQNSFISELGIRQFYVCEKY